ncbi:hypothetical protein EBT31_19945 [bacterium]|nr:hypothetical protein [bacterium]
MAQVVYSYTPTAGAVFSTTGWNTDIWSSKDGESVYGELNGHLQDANMDPAFLVQPEHVRPGEGFVCAEGSGQETLTYLDSLFGTEGVSGVDDGDWLIVPGTSQRLYVPWDANAVLFNVSAYITNQRQRETLDPTPVVAEWGGPEMYVALMIDGSLKAHTRRSFPYTYYPNNNPGDAESFAVREMVLTHHFDLVHMATGGAEVQAGYHDVALAILIPQTQTQENLVPRYKQAPKLALHVGRHRLRFGIRRGSILAL